MGGISGLWPPCEGGELETTLARAGGLGVVEGGCGYGGHGGGVGRDCETTGGIGGGGRRAPDEVGVLGGKGSGGLGGEGVWGEGVTEGAKGRIGEVVWVLWRERRGLGGRVELEDLDGREAGVLLARRRHRGGGRRARRGGRGAVDVKK